MLQKLLYLLCVLVQLQVATLNVSGPPFERCATTAEVRSIVQNETRSIVNEVISSEIQAQRNELRSQIRDVSQREQDSIISALQSAVSELRDTLQHLLPQPGSFQNPVYSCQGLPQGIPSGNYWIQSQSSPHLEYCDMSRRCCNNTRGWMRVANLDMTNLSHHCPSGFRQFASPRRTCGGQGSRCVSSKYPVHGVEYSRVCGRLKGYQYGSPDAFGPFSRNTRRRTIDQTYVDGVSLTHGRSPRKHIWTYAVGLIESHTTTNSCPCSHRRTFLGAIPSFVGRDYFCESGSQGGWTARLYTENPVWDGQGCRGSSTCCTFNNPPWFCKQLPRPTTEDIELRLCFDDAASNEDIRLEIIEIYVQ